MSRRPSALRILEIDILTFSEAYYLRDQRVDRLEGMPRERRRRAARYTSSATAAAMAMEITTRTRPSDVAPETKSSTARARDAAAEDRGRPPRASRPLPSRRRPFRAVRSPRADRWLGRPRLRRRNVIRCIELSGCPAARRRGRASSKATSSAGRCSGAGRSRAPRQPATALGSLPAVTVAECLDQAHALLGAVARAMSPSRAPALTTPAPASDAESGPGDRP